MDIVYLDFRQVFDTILHQIFLEKLLMYRLDEQRLRWTENWLGGWMQRVVVSSTRPSWRPVK